MQVCWRRLSKRYCTVKRARAISGSIVLCSVLYNSLRFLQFNLNSCLHVSQVSLILSRKLYASASLITRLFVIGNNNRNLPNLFFRSCKYNLQRLFVHDPYDFAAFCPFVGAKCDDNLPEVIGYSSNSETAKVLLHVTLEIAIFYKTIYFQNTYK